LRFISQNIREVKVLRRYHIQNREDYLKYNRLVGEIQRVVHRLKRLAPEDAYRIQTSEQIMMKLFNMGLIPSNKNLSECEKITVSSFCRRRLPVLMVRLKMSETIKEAITFIEQGHVRVGPEVVTDPAFLVTRSLEDFVTWVDSSKIKATIQKYNDKLDDYDLLQE
jgi:U3 small nucleolar ribonucleoprotein protein IMP3